jgi:hypothetical protein
VMAMSKNDLIKSFFLMIRFLSSLTVQFVLRHTS